MKKIHTLVAAIGIALAGGGAWWWQHRMPQSAGASAATPTPADGSKPSAGATAGRAGAGGPGAGGPGGPSGPAAVEVAKAEAQSLVDDVQAVGSLKSAQGVMLRPEVSGRISKLGFAEGAMVRRGQLLVQLDDTLQMAQLQQAQAQSSIARTNLQRSRELQAQGFVSQSAVDQNAAALEVAEAQVTLAKAQVARMKVLAPFDGTAGLRAVDVGDYVKDGADLVNLENLGSLRVQFAVPERYIDRLRAGQAVEVAVDAIVGRSFKGRVLAVDSQVDANGRALQVLAQVDNPGSQLKPGMFARPRVVFSVRPNAVVVPEEAIVPLGTRQLLFKVVDGAGGQKVAQRLEAKVGLRLPGRVEILEGVQAGDLLVTAGHSRLLRGDNVPVRPIDLSRGVVPAAKGGAARPAASGASGAAAGPASAPNGAKAGPAAG